MWTHQRWRWQVRFARSARQALLPFSRPRQSSRREGRQAQIFPRTPTPGTSRSCPGCNQTDRPGARRQPNLFAAGRATPLRPPSRHSAGGKGKKRVLVETGIAALYQDQPGARLRQSLLHGKSLRKAPNRPRHRRWQAISPGFLKGHGFQPCHHCAEESEASAAEGTATRSESMFCRQV